MPALEIIEVKADMPPEEKARVIQDYSDILLELPDEDLIEPPSNLAYYLKSVWQTNLRHHDTYVRPILDECTRRLRGEYDAETKSLIAETGGTDTYLPVAAQLAKIAEAWLIDILDSSSLTNRPWDIEPTPVAALPHSLEERINEKLALELEEARAEGAQPSEEEIQQRTNELYAAAFDEVNRIAREAVENQKKLIDDVLEEANFTGELKRFIKYLCSYPTAFLWGPFYKNEWQSKWINNELEQVETIVERYKAVSPYDIFPGPRASNLEEGDLVHLIRMNRRELSMLKGLQGTDDQAIDEVLANFDNYHKWATSQVTRTEKEAAELKDITELHAKGGTVEVLCFYCTVPIDQLADTDPELVEACLEENFVEIEAMMVGDHIIRCNVVDTKKPYFRRPFYFTSYRTVPDSIWGEGVIQISSEIEDICNSTVRALINNLSIASGPQVAIDPQALPQGQSIETLRPWQIWQVNAISSSSGRLPINFFQPDSNAQVLMGVFNTFLQRAAEITGIPWFLGGANPSAGAAATAKGLAQLLESSAKGLKLCLSNITEEIIKPVVYQQFQSNMLKGKGPLVYGDIKVIPAGFNALVLGGAQEERVREFIQLVGGSPQAFDVVGIDGFAELLRQYGAISNLDINGVIPTPEELEEKKKMAMEASKKPSPEETKAQIELAKLELDKKKHEDRMAIQRERMQIELQKKQIDLQIAQLKVEGDLVKQDKKDQADIQQEVVRSLGKERQIAQEGEIKKVYGSGI